MRCFAPTLHTCEHYTNSVCYCPVPHFRSTHLNLPAFKRTLASQFSRSNSVAWIIQCMLSCHAWRRTVICIRNSRATRAVCNYARSACYCGLCTRQIVQGRYTLHTTPWWRAPVCSTYPWTRTILTDLFTGVMTIVHEHGSPRHGRPKWLPRIVAITNNLT